MGRRVARKEEKRKKRNLKIKLLFGFVLLLVLAYVGSCALVSKDTIVKGVSMNGVDLGGMTKTEAAEKLAENYEKNYQNACLMINAVGNDYVIPMYSSLAFDQDAAAQKAYAFAHGNFIMRGYEMLKALTMGEEMHAYPVIANTEALLMEMNNSGITVLNTTVQTSYQLVENELQFIMGTTGYTVDMDGLNQSILKAVASNDYASVIEAPLVQGSVDPIDMDAIYAQIYAEKREPTLDKKNKYKVVEGVTGINFDKDAASQQVAMAAEGDVVHIEIIREEPKISNEDFKKHLFEAVLGKCTTDVSGTAARISNVKLAARTINGTILLPGEEFAYNNRVGQRTAARGYQKAPAYSDGQTIQELGGGVCQVSSTLYKSVVLSNLEVVEHHNHTYESSYIGLGMDATVSWDGPDFRFKNNMDYPIKIEMEYDHGQLTSRIKGAKLNDNTVKFTAEVLKTIPFDVKYEKDKTLKKGEEKTKESGHTGYVVQTYRIILDKKGKQISKTKEDLCNYSKKDAIVLKGTKEDKKQEAAPDPAADGSSATTASTEKKNTQ